MVSSRWQNRNLWIEVIGWVIVGLMSVGFYNLPSPFLNLPNEPRFGLAMLILIVGFMVLGRLSNDHPRVMVRVLRTEQEAATILIQKALKAEHIRFSRRPDTEAEVTRFRFSGTDLILQLEPYLIDNLPLEDALKKYPATKLTLCELRIKNRKIAARIAAAIDEGARE